MSKTTFTVVITTKNRKKDLAVSLAKMQPLLANGIVEFILCDDGSTDGTAVFIRTNYPHIQLIQNKKSKGLIYSRNRLLRLVTTDYAISLDDDAHFISENTLLSIGKYFGANPNCGVLALRIFWGLAAPSAIITTETPIRVQGFVGCGHIWRMRAWRTIPDYPDWFIFYGEEDFASFQLLKKNIEIHYFPEVLVHHRVDVKERKNNSDYTIRLRRSLRSGWYLFFLFYPLRMIPRKMGYSIWMQLQLKVFKGDFKALYALSLALFDLIFAIPKIIKNANRLTLEEYVTYKKLEPTKVYWKLEK
jgi:glycosyltransferase involved in cell wall biosynthesis